MLPVQKSLIFLCFPCYYEALCCCCVFYADSAGHLFCVFSFSTLCATLDSNIIIGVAELGEANPFST